MGVRAPVPLGSAPYLRWGSAPEVRARLGVRALARVGVRAPAPLGVRALPAPGVRAPCRTVAEVLGDCMLTSFLWAPQGGSAGRFLPPAQFRAPAPYAARVAIGGPTLFRSPCAATSPMFRAQSVTTSGAGPPVPRTSMAAASSALLGKRLAGVQPLPEAMLAGPPKRVRAQEPTTAAAVLRACKAVCALDPVVSGKDGRAAAADGCGFTSALRLAVLRRWELTKLVAVLPDYALARAVNMSLVDFAAARPDRIAQYLFARAGAVTPAYIAQSRSALLRLLRYNHDYGVPWDGAFGQLSEVDLFSFLLSVHSGALGKASGVWKGLHYLVQRLRLELPTDAVKTALPSAGSLRGRRALLQGAVPLPPESLASLFAYVCDPSKPRVLRSWAFALAFSTVSSLRQANAQNVSFYGELHVLGRDYLLSQHADPKSRGRVPTVFVTPLQDFSCSTAWFVQGRSLLWPQGDFLWADVRECVVYWYSI